MFNTVKNVLSQGGYNLTDILNKIEILWVKGKLTDEQQKELIALARDGAKPKNSIDVLAKLDELEKRIRALEGDSDNSNSETYLEFKKGMWYYTGDKVSFEGEIYICTAPEGHVCVWSPTEFPAYWKIHIIE